MVFQTLHQIQGVMKPTSRLLKACVMCLYKRGCHPIGENISDRELCQSSSEITSSRPYALEFCPSHISQASSDVQ